MLGVTTVTFTITLAVLFALRLGERGQHRRHPDRRLGGDLRCRVEVSPAVSAVPCEKPGTFYCLPLDLLTTHGPCPPHSIPIDPTASATNASGFLLIALSNTRTGTCFSAVSSLRAPDKALASPVTLAWSRPNSASLKVLKGNAHYFIG